MRILDGRESFYQWDLNQKITSNKFKVGDEIHFTNGRQQNAPVVLAYELDGKVVAEVPNIFFQSTYPITAYVYVDNRTIDECTFDVVQRPKPEDYVYTETEVLTYKSLEDRIKAIEESGAGGGITEETDPTVPEWAKQPEKPKYTALDVGAVSTENQSFVNAGNFFTLNELTSYDFDSNKVYKLYVGTTITTADNVDIPLGDYTCTSSVYSANNIWLRLVPIIPNGYYWNISVQEKTSYKVDFAGHEETGEMYEYFEEELSKKANVTQVQAIHNTIGDIDTALANIVALQESYIGGATE